MFKHFVFLLYLLSFTSGIGAITLGYFLYKYRLPNKALKNFLYADLFLGLILALNTLNYYAVLTQFPNQLLFSYLFVYSLLFAACGLLFFLSQAVTSLLGLEVTRKQKLFYLYVVVIGVVLLAAIHKLTAYGLIEYKIAKHLACFVSTILTTGGVWYNVYLLFSNKNKIPDTLQPMLRVVCIISLVITATAVVADILGCFWYTEYPVAISPISYFILNLAAIIFLRRYLLGFFNDTDKVLLENTAKQLNYDNFCRSYGITPRELEIVLLIAAGSSNQEISDSLYISLNTARNHIYNIYKKLGIKKRRELISILNTSAKGADK